MKNPLFVPAQILQSIKFSLLLLCIIPFGCNESHEISQENLIPFKKLNNRFIYVNANMKTVINDDFYEASLFKNGLAIVSDSLHEFYINKSGDKMFGDAFERVKPFKDGVGRIRLKGKWGCIDKFGKMLIVPTWEQMGEFSDGLAAVRKDGLWGFVNRIGELKIPIIYSDVSEFKSGFSKVELASQTFYIDKNGKAWKE